MTEIPGRLQVALADRYRIDRELGAGGMATVYLAHDVRHDRKVALKVLRPELAAVIGADRFLKEIKVTANLQHPHILGLIDSGEVDSLLYYVMPYVEGESLRDRLTREVYVRRYDDPGAGRTQVSVVGGAEPRWAHSGRELFFRGSRAEMMVAEVTLGAAFRAGPPRVLFPATRMASDYFHRSYDVGPDDRRFLMIRASEGETELVLVVNWFEELKGMVPK
jgi:hypothetical protein